MAFALLCLRVLAFAMEAGCGDARCCDPRLCCHVPPHNPAAAPPARHPPPPPTHRRRPSSAPSPLPPQIAWETKAEDVLVLHVAPVVYWTRYMLLATVFSRPQLNAILVRRARRAGEGQREGGALEA